MCIIDSLKADAKALTGNGSYGYSCPLDQWYYMSLVMTAGGTIFNETEDGLALIHISEEYGGGFKKGNTG